MTTLPVSSFLDQLFRNPLPELMDGECLGVLRSMNEKQGDRETTLLGYEVRLNDPERYVDCILCVQEQRTPAVDVKWVELDYDSLKEDAASPGECFFVPVGPTENGYRTLFEEILPAYAGNGRTERLTPVLKKVLYSLPEGVYLRHIGCMDGRGEEDIMRLIINCGELSTVGDCLTEIGWPGDACGVMKALKRFEGYEKYRLNVDISTEGILKKLGIEIFFKWRNPALIDMILDKLVSEGLCLPTKVQAVKRWIRVLPDANPFLQTALSYFKLVYADGRFRESKAYIGHQREMAHYSFPAYYRPVHADIELSGAGGRADTKIILERLRECRAERIPSVRFYGSDTHPDTEEILNFCKKEKLSAEVVLTGRESPSRLRALKEAGAEYFLIETDGSEENDFEAANILRELDVSSRSLWLVLTPENADDFEELTVRAENAGITEMILAPFFISGNKRDTSPKKWFDDDQLEGLAQSIHRISEDRASGRVNMELFVSSCFSPLRARLGGKDPHRNPNRGIGRGCEAGRSILAVLSDGSLAPCLMLKDMSDDGNIGSFWEGQDITDLRDTKERWRQCRQCPYERRCLPCPANGPCGGISGQIYLAKCDCV